MGGTLALETSSAEETRALGGVLAAVLEPGDVVTLTGDLGAGKTTLVQGIARGLGVEQPVLSPTFLLVKEYAAGEGTLFHLDVYRLDHIQDVLDRGFDEMLDREGFVLIEWGDGIEALLPQAHLRVELTILGDADGEGDDGRRVRISGTGAEWARRWDTLAQATEPWRPAGAAA